jgi:hypothetical protein
MLATKTLSKIQATNSANLSNNVRGEVTAMRLLSGLSGDSSVGVATCYGLDGLGIESRWGRDLPHPCRPALVPTQPPVQWVPGLSGVQRPGRGLNHPLAPRLKKE